MRNSASKYSMLSSGKRTQTSNDHIFIKSKLARTYELHTVLLIDTKSVRIFAYLPCKDFRLFAFLDCKRKSNRSYPTTLIFGIAIA
ncbi:hypothetical protein Nepgr_033374 [Nepenthes gracilis]|uniref:Uncharacterized protein n=1 Tax=Nepenthes gracilis TaxID=150966 RepID=A0AAD3Y8Y1_NEPGR|nr:hypothetical protein Nepgr_033374 [Nepenthes gracilis]